MGILAVLMLIRVDRWVIPLGFSIIYCLSQYFLVVNVDPVMTIDELYKRFYSVSFILFIVFMLTDPKTTPEKYSFQLIFAFCIAMTATFLDVVNGFRVQHLFFSLAFFSACSPCVEFFEHKIIKPLQLIKTALVLFLVVGVIINVIKLRIIALNTKHIP